MGDRDNEFIPYWDAWLGWMRTQDCRRFAWYVWDQGPGMPGDWSGRFAPSFEFVFHFNRSSRKPNKIVPCKHAGQESHLREDGSSTAMRSKEGEVGGWTHAGQPTQDSRIPDSVIRVMRHKGKIGRDIDHPAVFPVALPEFVVQAFTDRGDVVFEPFGGSGTTMLTTPGRARPVRWRRAVLRRAPQPQGASRPAGQGRPCFRARRRAVRFPCAPPIQQTASHTGIPMPLRRAGKPIPVFNGEKPCPRSTTSA